MKFKAVLTCCLEILSWLKKYIYTEKTVSLVSNDHYRHLQTFCTHLSSLTIMHFLLVEQMQTKSKHHWLTPGPDRIAIKVLCDDLSPVVRSLMWWESFRRWITWCIFNFPAVAPVQDSVGQMEMSAGQAGDISRRGLQHLRHDVRRSLPEAGQEGVRVILATKEKQQRKQKVSGQFRKRHISSDLLRERTQGPLMGEWSPKTARDYYPSSPLLFVLVQYTAAALAMLSPSELHHK